MPRDKSNFLTPPYTIFRQSSFSTMVKILIPLRFDSFHLIIVFYKIVLYLETARYSNFIIFLLRIILYILNLLSTKNRFTSNAQTSDF